MSRCRSSLLLTLAVLAMATVARAQEGNAWPAYVRKVDPTDHTQEWSALGPFLFAKEAADGGRTSGFRPFYVWRQSPHGDTIETTVLYPLFYYRRYGGTYEWSIFKLINRVGRMERVAPADQPSAAGAEHNFDVWPFYFSHRAADPAESYHALLPIYGDVRNLLGYGRLSWTLFPLYVQTEKAGSTTTYLPWPIVRSERGVEHGFAVWPLFGHYETPGIGHRSFYLWPFVWNNSRLADPDRPAVPTHEEGILPFYTREVGPSGVDQAYFWPFFGYTDRTLPQPYHETRYFWPFLVQGRGEAHWTHRWGPFYTHSYKKEVESRWILWPLWNRRTWQEAGLDQENIRFFFFFYSSNEQRSLAHPAAAPAIKRHVFPLLSSWDNGAGRKQLEILSPFEPLFADNPEIREAWSPLFALYRYDQRAPDDARSSLLWNAVSWARKPGVGLTEFHLGPIVALHRRPDGAGWRTFWFDFSPNRPMLEAQPR